MPFAVRYEMGARRKRPFDCYRSLGTACSPVEPFSTLGKTIEQGFRQCRPAVAPARLGLATIITMWLQRHWITAFSTPAAATSEETHLARESAEARRSSTQ